MRLKTFVVVLFATVIIIFSIQNVEVTEIKFLFWKLSMSRVLVILGSFSIGILVGVLISIKRKITPKKII